MLKGFQFMFCLQIDTHAFVHCVAIMQVSKRLQNTLTSLKPLIINITNNLK